MGLFGGGSKNERHETPCPARDDGGPSWVRKDYRGKNNPMGWGSDEPRAVKGSSGKTMHGSRAERRLMSGTGALIKQDASKVKVSGEKPRGRKR